MLTSQRPVSWRLLVESVLHQYAISAAGHRRWTGVQDSPLKDVKLVFSAAYLLSRPFDKKATAPSRRVRCSVWLGVILFLTSAECWTSQVICRGVERVNPNQSRDSSKRSVQAGSARIYLL